VRSLIGVLVIGVLLSVPSIALQTASADDLKLLLPFLKDVSFSGTPSIHLSTGDLQTVKNPKGSGTLIFAKPSKNLYGRKPIWIVLSSTVYALNGPAKDFAPGLKFPREAPDKAWKPSGLNQYSVDAEVLRVTYGK
jgi:hypothetical protein